MYRYNYWTDKCRQCRTIVVGKGQTRCPRCGGWRNQFIMSNAYSLVLRHVIVCLDCFHEEKNGQYRLWWDTIYHRQIADTVGRKLIDGAKK